MTKSRVTVKFTNAALPIEVASDDDDTMELAYLQRIREEVGEGYVRGARRASLLRYSRDMLEHMRKNQAFDRGTLDFWKTSTSAAAASLANAREALEIAQQRVENGEKRVRELRRYGSECRKSIKRSEQRAAAYEATVKALEAAPPDADGESGGAQG